MNVWKLKFLELVDEIKKELEIAIELESSGIVDGDEKSNSTFILLKKALNKKIEAETEEKNNEQLK